MGGQAKKGREAKQWIEYDSNVAEVDGTLHVFSDAAVSDDEGTGPPRIREKYVLLDNVPQVSCCHHSSYVAESNAGFDVAVCWVSSEPAVF